MTDYDTITVPNTSSNSSNYSIESQGGAGSIAKDILLTPHNVQVLTIFKLLRVAEPISHLQNQLMQIRTGEGKSIILGALATIFGLLGFRVRCVCYSEYLSSRDYNDFQEVFQAFSCDDSITYSKIPNFSEDLVAEKGNIRQLTSNMISSNTKAAKEISYEEHKIS